MLRSLRWRLAGGYLLLVAAVLVALGLVLGAQARHDAALALDARVTAEARALAQAARAVVAGERPAVQLAALVREAVSSEIAAFVAAANGVELFPSFQAPASAEARAPEVAAALAGGVARTVRRNPQTGVSELYVAVPVVSDGRVAGAARVAASRDGLGEAVQRVWVRTGVAGAAALVAGAALLLVLTAPLRSGLRELAGVTGRLAGGQIYERAEMPPFSEAGDLSISINHMAASLEAQVRAGYQERDTFGVVIDGMADGLLLIDQEGGIRLANPAAARLFAAQGPDLVGRRLMEAVRDHEITRIVERAWQEGRQQVGQVEHGRELRLLRISVTPLLEKGGRSALVLFQDLTEVQRLGAMRREFVANVSHELRTPLASVKAAAEALEGGALDEPTAARDFLNRIIIEVDHMTNLVQRLLDLSRLETGKAQFDIKSLDAKAVVAEAVERVRPRVESQGLALIVELPEGLPRVRADRAALHEVLLNLLDNAINFTRAGHIRVSARAADGAVEVAVEDTGSGILPEDLPHVFERFYKADRSRSSPGAGLGLALAKHAVQAQGGRIWAESAPGRGSAFRFTLPAADEGS